jgi:hypothetical protein
MKVDDFLEQQGGLLGTGTREGMGNLGKTFWCDVAMYCSVLETLLVLVLCEYCELENDILRMNEIVGKGDCNRVK